MPEELLLNIHAVLPCSRVNGPGLRMVVFFQGCARGCPGCFNPDTHLFETREEYRVRDIFAGNLADAVEGITVSGGEPFLQPEGLFELLKAARTEWGLTTVVYTGYTCGEIMARARTRECLKYIDVLVDGAYVEEKKEKTLLARGSTNQRFYFLTPRYTLKDFYMPGKVEVIIGSGGVIMETGFSRVMPRHSVDI